MVLQAVSCTLTLTAIPRGFEAEVFTGWMPFLSHNKQRQITEGNKKTTAKRYTIPKNLLFGRALTRVISEYQPVKKVGVYTCTCVLVQKTASWNSLAAIHFSLSHLSLIHI